MEGGGQPGVILVLHGDDTGGTDVWIGVLGDVIRNDGDGRENPREVFTKDHREAGKTASRKVMGDNGGRGGSIGSGDAVSGNVHSPLAGNGSTVGGSMANIGGLCTGNRL